MMRILTGRRLGISSMFVLGLTILALVVASCSSGDGGAASNSEPSEQMGEDRGVPTMPAASFGQPTTMIDPTKVAERDATPEPDEVDAASGEQVYSRLCADCHGEALEGVSGSAEPIDEYESDVASLTDLLRTGGGFGPDHIFGLDKVSPQGIASLHAYLQALDEEE
jgi:mono/diheme cytochrome c family protein